MGRRRCGIENEDPPTESGGKKHEEHKQERLEIGQTLNVATYNVRGMVQAGKREMLEMWAKSKDVDIILLQETKINQAGFERRKHYSIFQRK